MGAIAEIPLQHRQELKRRLQAGLSGPQAWMYRLWPLLSMLGQLVKVWAKGFSFAGQPEKHWSSEGEEMAIWTRAKAPTPAEEGDRDKLKDRLFGDVG